MLKMTLNLLFKAYCIGWLVSCLEDNSFNADVIDKESWYKLFRLLGERFLLPSIKKNGAILSRYFKNAEFLARLSPETDIHSYDQLLISLMEGISNRDIVSLDKQSKYNAICMLETVYSFVNFNWQGSDKPGKTWKTWKIRLFWKLSGKVREKFFFWSNVREKSGKFF